MRVNSEAPLAKFAPALFPEHRAFVAKQPVFFVATAVAGDDHLACNLAVAD